MPMALFSQQTRMIYSAHLQDSGRTSRARRRVSSATDMFPSTCLTTLQSTRSTMHHHRRTSAVQSHCAISRRKHSVLCRLCCGGFFPVSAAIKPPCHNAIVQRLCTALIEHRRPNEIVQSISTKHPTTDRDSGWMQAGSWLPHPHASSTAEALSEQEICQAGMRHCTHSSSAVGGLSTLTLTD